eukprot:UN00244
MIGRYILKVELHLLVISCFCVLQFLTLLGNQYVKRKYDSTNAVTCTADQKYKSKADFCTLLLNG